MWRRVQRRPWNDATGELPLALGLWGMGAPDWLPVRLRQYPLAEALTPSGCQEQGQARHGPAPGQLPTTLQRARWAGPWTGTGPPRPLSRAV
jgi:hypothetical protein